MKEGTKNSNHASDSAVLNSMRSLWLMGKRHVSDVDPRSYSTMEKLATSASSTVPDARINTNAICTQNTQGQNAVVFQSMTITALTCTK